MTDCYYKCRMSDIVRPDGHAAVQRAAARASAFFSQLLAVAPVKGLLQIGSNQGCDNMFTDVSAFAWHGYDATDLYFAVTARPSSATRRSDHYLCERDHWGRPTVALLQLHPHVVNRAAEDEDAAELLYKLLLHEVCVGYGCCCFCWVWVLL